MTYIFNTQPNSYFHGQDLRVEDTETHEIAILNVKENHWAVSIKDDVIYRDYPADVSTAIDALGEDRTQRLYEEGVEDFWRAAENLAQEHGFKGVMGLGRSGGWMAVEGTEDLTIEDIHAQKGTAQQFLELCFEALSAIDGARSYFFQLVLEAMGELQVELSKYADWVGAEVRTLDSMVFEVAKLSVINGKPALHTGHSGFAFAKEATLVRKANGQIPARLTADPIMEQVLQIIEARGNLSRERIDHWLDADDDNDPICLYEQHVAPAVNAIEDLILEGSE